MIIFSDLIGFDLSSFLTNIFLLQGIEPGRPQWKNRLDQYANQPPK